MTVEDCTEVVELVIKESHKSGRPLSLKQLDLCYNLFAQFQKDLCRLGWRERVTSLMERCTPRARSHRVGSPGSIRRDRRESDYETLERILRDHPDDRKEQIRFWKELTGKCESMFYERLAQLERMR